MKNVRVYEIELTKGLYTSLIGKTVQVKMYTNLEIGEEIQLTENYGGLNVNCWFSSEIEIFHYSDNVGSCRAMLGQVKKVLFSYEVEAVQKHDSKRENVFCSEDYKPSKNVNALLFDTKGERFN